MAPGSPPAILPGPHHGLPLLLLPFVVPGFIIGIFPPSPFPPIRAEFLRENLPATANDTQLSSKHIEYSCHSERRAA
jgi:hypothetical protein